MTNPNTQTEGRGTLHYLFLYFILAILLIVSAVFLIRYFFFNERTIDASILKHELFVNEDLVFTDNTPNAKGWLWEFGDGAHSTQQNGSHRFAVSGSYIVRLTVDNELRTQFAVMVKDTIVAVRDTLLSINGPTSGIVNEEIRLEAVGPGSLFEWSFGESGRVDAKGRTAFYRFRSPGKYLVQLRSELNRPVNHLIYITDPRIDSVLVIPGEGDRVMIDDIRARLQAIADGADFNSNYYYLVRTYLCGNEKISVKVDQNKLSHMDDFYSYCMGLTFAKGIFIDKAELVTSPNAACATQLTVKQHTVEKSRSITTTEN